jgi:NADP-dependent 3-hydroxy acid dehydrogenase YdfG
MKKVIAVLGAGRALSSTIARHYGAQGFVVALVGRNKTRLGELAKQFGEEGIETAVFPADLSIEYYATKVVNDIEEQLGRVDVLWYGPVPDHEFARAENLTVAMMRPYVDVFFYGLVASVHAVLPGMKQRGEGTILAGFGGTAQGGLPGLSGPGPAMNAGRNYLQSLQREMLEHMINVGALTISGAIRGSVDADRYDTPGGADHIPEKLSIPMADPMEMLELLLAAAADPDRLEARWPAVPPIPYLD